jgi:pSer/pThr/pTyr-binding forkhead associated (FHA) protein
VKTTCGFCGQLNEAVARYCSDCGKPLTTSAAIAQAAYTPTAGGTIALSASAIPQKGEEGGGKGALEGGYIERPRGGSAFPGPKCRKCGHTTDARYPFCANCGTRAAGQAQESACRNCGRPYVNGADTFCSSCGTRVGERVSIVKPLSALIDAKLRASGPRLAILDERGEPSSVFELDRGEAIIGRGDADIKFQFDVFLSPLHARIDLNDGSLWLRDLGSRNGSWVFIEEPTKLIDGDLILIGSQILRFRRLGYPGPHPPEADSTRRMGSVTPAVDVAVIEQLRADGSVRDAFHLSPGRDVMLGRETGDWIFPYDQTMSGKHAEIVSEDIEFFIHDSGSRNGVAMAVRGDRRLRKGQRFLVGDQIMRVENV